jgi:hypothetical protein
MVANGLRSVPTTPEVHLLAILRARYSLGPPQPPTGGKIAPMSLDPGRRPGQSKARASSCSQRLRTIR